MLKDHLYQITGNIPTGINEFTIGIKFNRSHEIFNGHFPGLPVVPGVCMMAIVKEFLEASLQKKLTLRSASQMKFLSLINPEENEMAEVAIKYVVANDGTITADGTILVNQSPFFKLVKGIYS